MAERPGTTACRRAGTRTAAALLAGLLLILPAVAGATPVGLWFDGPTFGGTLPIGVSESSALGSGLEIHDDALTDPTGLLDVTSQVLDDSSIVWPVPPSFEDPVQASSDWTVEAQQPFAGRVLMVFVTTTDVEYLGLSGLTVDAEEGWLLVRSQLEGQDVYLPAVDLGLLPVAGAIANTPIHYLVATALKWDATNGRYLLPQLMMAVTTLPTAVPEPGGLLLLACASALLAARQRRTR